MNPLKNCLLLLTIALLSGCASAPKPSNGLYELSSVSNAGLSIDTAVTLSLSDDYLLIAGPLNTWSAPIKKNTVGSFTLQSGSSAPNVYTRMFLGSLKDSSLKGTSNGELTFTRNDKIVATFTPINLPASAAPVGQ